MVPLATLATPGRRGALPLDQIAFADFAAHEGAAFRVLIAQVPVGSLELVEAQLQPSASVGPAPALDGHNEAFVLLFRGERTLRLPQDTYEFQQAHLGQFSIFIVPAGHQRRQDYSYYEAIFNRRSPTPCGASTTPC